MIARKILPLKVTGQQAEKGGKVLAFCWRRRKLSHGMKATFECTDELDKVLMSVARCIECTNPPCMQACPQSVNIRDALRLLIETHPAAARYNAIVVAARSDPDWGKGCE